MFGSNLCQNGFLLKCLLKAIFPLTFMITILRKLLVKSILDSSLFIALQDLCQKKLLLKFFKRNRLVINN